MAWGFAQLEGCILIYSNWNGKAKMTRTLTFLLRYSQAGSELTTRIALRHPSSPKPSPKGKEERGRRKSAAGANGDESLSTCTHLLLFSTQIVETSRSINILVLPFKWLILAGSYSSSFIFVETA